MVEFSAHFETCMFEAATLQLALRCGEAERCVMSHRAAFPERLAVVEVMERVGGVGVRAAAADSVSGTIEGSGHPRRRLGIAA